MHVRNTEMVSPCGGNVSREDGSTEDENVSRV